MNFVEVWPFRDEDGEWQIALYMGGVLVARFPFAESNCLVSPEGNVISGEPGRAWTPAVVKGGKHDPRSAPVLARLVCVLGPAPVDDPAEIVATRAGRRLEVATARGVVEVTEVTRGGTPVRTGRFMATRVVALVENESALRQTQAVGAQLAELAALAPREQFARKAFNEAATAYNAAIAQFPTRLLTRVFGFQPAGTL